jgi:hypothetical protein
MLYYRDMGIIGQKKTGGRQRGTLNKSTAAARERVEKEERQSGRRLAVERMAEAMEFWFGLAAQHQPNGPNPDQSKMKAALHEGTTIANNLAPYQSPKLQNTTLRSDADKSAPPIQVNVKFV